MAARNRHPPLQRTPAHRRPPLHAAFGPEVDDPIGLGDDVEGVLDHHHAVAAVPSAIEAAANGP